MVMPSWLSCSSRSKMAFLACGSTPTVGSSQNRICGWCTRLAAMFNRRRRPGIVRDVPLMLALSVLALPLVAPASLCIGSAFAIQWVYDQVAGWFE